MVGAADIGRKQALLEAREEERIDELGLPARELGEEGEHQPPAVQVLEEIVEADRLLDIELAGGLQPIVVRVDGMRELVAPPVKADDFGLEACR
jgi:hypothetical protein